MYHLQSLLQPEGLVALRARVRLVIRMVTDVIEPWSVTVVLAGTEDAGVDLGAVPRFGVVQAVAGVTH